MPTNNYFRTLLLIGSITYLPASFGAPSLEAENDRKIKEMQTAVAYRFLDPDSAKFRNIRKSPLGYCGEVNAKNSYGAYVGYKRFHAAFEDKSKEWLIAHDPQLVNVFCKSGSN